MLGRFFWGAAAVTTAAASSLLGAPSAHAQSAPMVAEVVCGSPNYLYRRCRAPQGMEIDRVELMRRASQRECDPGASWGWDPAGVWVDQGCHARFRLYAVAPARASARPRIDATAYGPSTSFRDAYAPVASDRYAAPDPAPRPDRVASLPREPSPYADIGTYGYGRNAREEAPPATSRAPRASPTSPVMSAPVAPPPSRAPAPHAPAAAAPPVDPDARISTTPIPYPREERESVASAPPAAPVANPRREPAVPPIPESAQRTDGVDGRPRPRPRLVPPESDPFLGPGGAETVELSPPPPLPEAGAGPAPIGPGPRRPEPREPLETEPLPPPPAIEPRETVVADLGEAAREPAPPRRPRADAAPEPSPYQPDAELWSERGFEAAEVAVAACARRVMQSAWGDADYSAQFERQPDVREDAELAGGPGGGSDAAVIYRVTGPIVVHSRNGFERWSVTCRVRGGRVATFDAQRLASTE